MLLGIIATWLDVQHHHRVTAQRVAQRHVLHVVAALVAMEVIAAIATTIAMGQARTLPTPHREVT